MPTPGFVVGLDAGGELSDVQTARGGNGFTCAIAGSLCAAGDSGVCGQVLCWGANTSGQLGGDAGSVSSVPVPVLAPL